MTLASLYLWSSSAANSYIQPNFVLHRLQETSRTQCRPVSMILSAGSLKLQIYSKMHGGMRDKKIPNLEGYLLLLLASAALINSSKKPRWSTGDRQWLEDFRVFIECWSRVLKGERKLTSTKIELFCVHITTKK